MAATLPMVAIVGRPNVGKSMLFNRLVRARRAIVDDVPGVTRDRVVAPATHAGRSFLCADTGGFSTDVPRDAAAMLALVRRQTLAAIDEADCVVCVFDGQLGLAPEDREMVRLLRRTGKAVLYVVNKIDNAGREALVHDFAASGAAPLLAVSAAHDRGLVALRDAIVAALPDATTTARAEPAATRLAIVGRPNVGKSSLLNRLLGEERTIVAPEAGTTRDAIDTLVTVDARPYVLIDTAGIRKRGRIREPLEGHGAVRALGTLARSDLVFVVLDAAEGMTEQDARIVGRAWEAGRGVILVANKWDTLPDARQDRGGFRQALVATHAAFAELPLLFTSAQTGDGVRELFPVVRRLERAYDAALPTPALNRELRAAVASHPPPGARGRPVRLLYATQTGRRPPTITVFASAPTAIPQAYVRYLEKRWTHAFGLAGVPLRVRFRARSEAAAPRGRRPSTAPRRIRARSTRGRARR